MAYHRWGEEGVDWAGIDDAANFIGDYLTKRRVCVQDVKEKWGTVRVYCHFGYYSLYNIIYPRRIYLKGKFSFLSHISVPRWVNRLFIVPYQEKAYRKAYLLAIQKWPHLREEILQGADFDELLKGL